MDVLNITLSEGLQMITAMFGGTYFGCMLYTSLIEANSRRDLPVMSHWEQWCNSHRRAAKLMPLAGVVTAAASLGVYYLERKSPVRCLWLVPPGAVLFVILYTLVFMLQLNNSILERKILQTKPLAGVVTAAASLGVYYLERKSPVRCLWLVPPGAVLFVILYTLVFMLQLNNSILERKNITDKGWKWVKDSTARWERLHLVRTLAMLVSQCVTLYAIIKL